MPFIVLIIISYNVLKGQQTSQNDGQSMTQHSHCSWKYSAVESRHTTHVQLLIGEALLADKQS